jgi:uncharacterized membrane protein YgcG
MTWERDHQGNYVGGLTNGATSYEQQSAGVNQYDSPTSAYEKVEVSNDYEFKLWGIVKHPKPLLELSLTDLLRR